MLDNTELVAKLKEKKIRVTGQRFLVLQLLAEERSHLSVDEIFKSLTKRFGTVSRASVYNVLKSLVDVQLVRELTPVSGKAFYEYVHEEHLHFVCDSCSKIIDVYCSEIPNIELPQKWRKRAREIDITVRGVCPQCS